MGKVKRKYPWRWNLKHLPLGCISKYMYAIKFPTYIIDVFSNVVYEYNEIKWKFKWHITLK